jgi:hypothetical protein
MEAATGGDTGVTAPAEELLESVTAGAGSVIGFQRSPPDVI